MVKMKHLALTVLMMFSAVAMAQKVTVSGKVLDGEVNEMMPSATVVLLKPDSTQATGVVTDSKGVFTLPSVKVGDYILKASFVGYRAVFQNLTLTKDKKKVDVGTITLYDDARLMKEATVTAALAQVEVKADTFVYNADAYRVPEGSTLEELVRKLPGAEVAEDGTIKINGKTISKVLMKGKELFGNDKEAALKNLSAKMVDKLKSYERKSDYTRITGIDDGEEETVLDLTVKRGMGEGWVINADLAAGNARQDVVPNAPRNLEFPKPLYSTMLNVNRFTDNLQFMAFFNRNNNNGGIGRWGGWGSGSGVTTNTMGGLNVTWTNGLQQYTKGYFEIGGNVRYSGRETENMSMSNSETFLSASSSSFSNSFNHSRSTNRSINADLRLEWMIDSLTTLTMRPNFSHSENKNWGDNTSVTFNADPYEITDNPLKDYDNDALFSGDEIRVNSNVNKSHSLGTSNSGRINFQLNRRLMKPGRNIALDMNSNISHSDNESFSWADIKYYQTGKNTLQDRYTVSPSKSWNIDTRLSYSEPLTDKLNLQLSYQYQRRFSDNDRSMYNLENLIGQSLSARGIDTYGDNLMTRDILEQIYLSEGSPSAALDNMINFADPTMDWQAFTRDAVNSQYATYKENNHNANLMFRYMNKLENGQELRLNAGASLQPQHTLMHYQKGAVDTTVTRTTINWAPRLDFRWKISNVSQFRINYNARMSQPSMTQLMEVTDDSNPLNVNTGNAGLRSSWANNFSAEYNGYKTETQTSWNVRAGYGNTKNSIASATIYDQNSGARYTRPMNINGNWNSWGNININSALGEKKYWNISNGVNLNYNYRLGYLSTNTDGDMSKFIDPATGRINMDKLFAATPLNESATKTLGIGDNMRINYRYTFPNENYSLEVSANGGFNYDHTRSTAQTNNNIDSWRFNYGGNATLMFPWSVTFTTNITEQSRRGYADKNMNTNELIWNASLQKSFLKDKAATIRVEWNDILHQRSNVSRAISEFSRSDTYTNNINSYFMVHFIYRLNLLGDKEARSMMRGMPGGEGRGGGWGGGRGPGGFGGGGGWGGGGRF